MDQSSGSSVQTQIFPPENIKNFRVCRNIVKMNLNCFVLDTGVLFPISLGEKVSVEKYEYSIESLSVGTFKEYIWERKNNILKDLTNDVSKLDLWRVNVAEVVNVSNEDDIVRELKGDKMKANFLLSDYFSVSDPPPQRNIHIIIHRPPTTDQGLTNVSRYIANLGYLPRQGGLGGTLLPTDLKVKSTNEGIILTDPDISLRFDIIPPLIRDLMKKQIILIRAPPFAGKTSIARILENSLVQSPEHSNCRVIRVSMIWGMSAGIENCYESFGELWKEMFGIGWSEWIAQCRRVKTILIIDEAQLIYKEDRKINKKDKKTADQFWTIVKGLTTPVTLPDSHCKSLIDIKFTPNELRNYVMRFCNSYFNLDQQSILNFYAYIQEITDGHAGLVRHILVTTEDAMNKRIVTNRLTFEDIFKYLNSKSFNSSIYANCRAVPKVSSLSDPQRGICKNIYLNEEVEYEDSNDDMVYLVKSGILIFKNNSNLTFAAPLLKRLFFQQNYGFTNSTDTTPTDLHHFIKKIFTAMCNEISGDILRNTLGFGSDGRLLEQTWQKEFYRIGTQVLGRDHFLSCEVGSVFGCEGKIDFYVDKLEWAIELLRDGEDMKEHKARFEPSGEYEEIVKYAKSIAIIDIRSIGRLDTRIEAKKSVWVKKP
uniref:Crinkler effector protein N-terminal domain-containing protein n=1 Tax=Rhizophagus irregularis (strain DAOM 181602 / DAOM 197198 / MUCL 43194) TaxID=747089 RepID=U9TXP5_RHIID